MHCTDRKDSRLLCNPCPGQGFFSILGKQANRMRGGLEDQPDDEEVKKWEEDK